MNEEVKQNAKKVATTIIDTIASVAGYPIMQPFLAVTEFVTKIREESYIKKLRFFFEYAEKVSDEQKEKFMKSLGDKRDDLVKKIFITIEQLDEDEKANIIGRLFRSLILGKMDTAKFSRLSLVVKNIFLSDLEHFQSKYSIHGEKVDNSFFSYVEDDLHITSSLIANGLIHEKDGGGVMTKIIPQHYYGVTSLGQLMLECGLKNE